MSRTPALGAGVLFEIADRQGNTCPDSDQSAQRLRRSMWNATTSRPSFQVWQDPPHPLLVGKWVYQREQLGIVECKFLSWHREVLPAREDVANGRIRVRIIDVPDETRRFLQHYRATRAERAWGKLCLPMHTRTGATY